MVNVRDYLAVTQPDVTYFDFFTNILGDASNYDRVPEVDWCRIIANWLVVIVHCVVAVQEMELKMTPSEDHSIRAFLVNLLQIGMPFLFAVTGRASAYVSETNYLKFILKKCVRLLVPLIACYFLIVIPAALTSGPFWTCRQEDMPEPTISNFFRFYSWYLRNRNCGVEWLWFLPILLIVSIATFPQVLWIVTYHILSTPDHMARPADIERRKKLIDDVETPWYRARAMLRANLTLLFGAGSMCLVTVLAARLLWHLSWLRIFVFLTPCLVSPLIMAALLPLSRRLNCREILLAFLPLSTLVMAAVKPGATQDMLDLGVPQTVVHFVTSTPFNCAFFLQGVIEQRIMYEWEIRQRLVMTINGQVSWHMITRPLKMLLWVALIAFGITDYYPQWGYPWSYPLYDEPYLAVTYVLGSWIYFHLLERLGMMYLRSVIDAGIFEHVARSSLFVYLFHGLSIGIVGRFLIWPIRNHINALIGISLFITFATPLTIAAYFVVLRIPPLAILFGMKELSRTPLPPTEETIQLAAKHV